MSEDTLNDLPQESELDALKARADVLGIKYHPSIGVDALKTKISEHMAGLPSEGSAAIVSEPVAETEAQIRNRVKLTATRQVRIRVTCMNPAKKDWEGEIFTVGNNAVGTLKKYVPFDTEWYVPQIMLNMIQERECQVFHTVNAANGQKVRKGKLVKEFAVEVLPDLTPAELKALAQRQAMAAGTGE